MIYYYYLMRVHFGSNKLLTYLYLLIVKTESMLNLFTYTLIQCQNATTLTDNNQYLSSISDTDVQMLGLVCFFNCALFNKS